MNALKNTKLAAFALATAAFATLGTATLAGDFTLVDKGISLNGELKPRLKIKPLTIKFPNCPVTFQLKEKNNVTFRCTIRAHNAQLPFALERAQNDNCTAGSYWNPAPKITTHASGQYHTVVKYSCTRS
jgi:hypothetical protein